MDQDHKFPDGEPEANFIILSLLGEKPSLSITTFPPHSRKKSRCPPLFLFSVSSQDLYQLLLEKFNSSPFHLGSQPERRIRTCIKILGSYHHKKMQSHQLANTSPPPPVNSELSTVLFTRRQQNTRNGDLNVKIFMVQSSTLRKTQTLSWLGNTVLHRQRKLNFIFLNYSTGVGKETKHKSWNCNVISIPLAKTKRSAGSSPHFWTSSLAPRLHGDTSHPSLCPLLFEASTGVLRSFDKSPFRAATI